MKLSKRTLTILKNYAAINSNWMIKKGNVQSTISVNKTIVGNATFEEDFPQEFGIYDLQELLNVISLFEEPEVEFTDNCIKINQGKNSIVYYGSDESVLVYPKKFPELGEPELEFDMSEADINAILRTSSILKTTDIRFINTDGNFSVVVGDSKTKTANSFIQQLPNVESDIGNFVMKLNTKNMVFIPQDFRVQVLGKRITKFIGETVTYYVIIEQDSVWG